MSEIYAGLNRLLVEVKEVDNKDSLIVSSKKSIGFGEIKSVGSIKDKKDIDETTFKVGDFVYFNPNAGIDIEIPNHGKFRLLNISDVLVGEKQ